MTQPTTIPLFVKQYFIKLKLKKKKEWKSCLVISFEIIPTDIWLYLPPPHSRERFSHYITNAVFSCLHTYVRNLHLWHTKTENSYRINQ